MKRYICLFLVLVLLAGLLAGCKKKESGADEAFSAMTPDELVAEAVRRFNALDGWSWDYETTLDCCLYDMTPSTAYQSTGGIDKAQLMTHGTFSLTKEGEPEELYSRLVERGGISMFEFARYSKAMTDEWDDEGNRLSEMRWFFRRVQPDESNPPAPDAPTPALGYGCFRYANTDAGASLLYIADNIGRALSAGEHFSRMEDGTVNGRAALRYEGTVSGEALAQLLGFTQLAWYFEVDAEDAPVQAGLPISIWIDAERLLPLRIELDATALMQQELALEAVISRTTRTDNPELLEKYAMVWDAIAVYKQGSLRIDLTPETPEIIIPAEISEGMIEGKLVTYDD